MVDTTFLVATHLSSLFPLQPISIPIQTSRQGVPLPPELDDSESPAEHATYSSTLHTQATGTILLRVLHNGLIIEVSSLSAEVPSLRFILPGAIISSPAIFLWESSEIHVIAVADTGSLFRIVVPIGAGRELWQAKTAGIWHREYLFKNAEDAQQGLVHVQGTHSVLVGSRSGSLLRLENDYSGEDSSGACAVTRQLTICIPDCSIRRMDRNRISAQLFSILPYIIFTVERWQS